MKTGKFSDFFVTFVVKKTMKPKNSDIITEDKVFHFVQGNTEIFCIADDFCKVFLMHRCQNRRFRHAFF